MEKINCNTSANLARRKVFGTTLEIGFDSENSSGDFVLINVNVGRDVEDIITVYFRADDFFAALGKAIQRNVEDDE